MTNVDLRWPELARELADHLRNDRHLRSGAWYKAFCEVPRHHFVPSFTIDNARDSQIYRRDDPNSGDEWLRLAYSDQSLIMQQLPHAQGTDFDTGEPLLIPTSSSTAPWLMARMLEALDVHDGHHVLEIGTGTGYNAALLTHGAGRVSTVDIDPELVATARNRLAELGYVVTVVTGDGTDGLPNATPFDRIIATAAVPEIPFAWVEQLATGGKILANVRGELAGGTVSLLTKTADNEACGHILDIGGNFMWARPDAASPHRAHELAENVHTPIVRAFTTIDVPSIVDSCTNSDFLFLAQLAMPGVQAILPAERPNHDTGDDVPVLMIFGVDSTATAYLQSNDGRYRVEQRGPQRLWDVLAETIRLWHDLNHPTIDRYGITVTDTDQYIWLDDPIAGPRWSLPLV